MNAWLVLSHLATCRHVCLFVFRLVVNLPDFASGIAAHTHWQCKSCGMWHVRVCVRVCICVHACECDVLLTTLLPIGW